MAKGWLSSWAIYDSAIGKYKLTNDDGSPSWEFPASRNGFVPITQSDDVYIKHVEHFGKILAAVADGVVSNEDLSAALPINCTIAAQPDVPRTLTWAFDSHAQITKFTLSIAGTNAKGDYVTEQFTEADGWSGETVNAFATITNIVVSARTGTGAGDTLDVGLGSKIGLGNNITQATDVFKVTKSLAAGNAADYSGAANITAEATYDTVDLSTGAAIVDGDSFTIHYKSRFYTQG